MSRLLSSLLLLLVCACSSTGSGTPAEPAGPVRISMRDYRVGLEMMIVNDGWLLAEGIPGETAEERRTNFYSTARTVDSSTTKVLSDPQVAAVVQVLEDRNGFLEYSQAGPQPAASGEYSSSIEITHGDQARHFGYLVDVQRMPREQQVAFVEGKSLVMEAYNYSYSLQTVDDSVEFQRGPNR